MSIQPTDQELGIHRFRLTDADGNEHEYLCTRHPAERGMRICFTLLGHASGALVPLLEPLLAGKISLGAMLSGSSDAQADKVLEGVDLSKAANEVRDLLCSPDSTRLVVDILSETSRDGKPLRLPANFSEAYRGNYYEMLRATWEVIGYNRFFPLPATS